MKEGRGKWFPPAYCSVAQKRCLAMMLNTSEYHQEIQQQNKDTLETPGKQAVPHRVRSLLKMYQSSLAKSRELLVRQPTFSRDLAISAIGYACHAAKEVATLHYLETQDIRASLILGAKLLLQILEEGE